MPGREIEPVTSFRGDVNVLVEKLTTVIIDPLLALLFAAGLLVFMWGVFQFLVGVSNESDEKEEGKKHMLWGVLGMFIMVAALAIIRIITSTFGLSLPR